MGRINETYFFTSTKRKIQMISKETCRKIYNCYVEIENAEKLFEDMQQALKEHGDLDLADAFGRRQPLQLGVPSGASSHRLYNVPPDLAIKVIEAHVKEQKELLIQYNAHAIIESHTES